MASKSKNDKFVYRALSQDELTATVLPWSAFNILAQPEFRVCYGSVLKDC